MIILPDGNERSPEEIREANRITRREVLRRVIFGSGAVLLPGLLAACVDDYVNPFAPKEEKDGLEEGDELSNMGSEPFLSQIGIASFNFAPKGWALCNGQILPINQNQALFSLLGTTYGGDGQTNFALPDLRGRVPIHVGNGHALGERAGSTNVTVGIPQLPAHIHGLQASPNSAGTTSDPTNAFLAPVSGGYAAASNLTTLEPTSVTSVGGNQAHPNMMPCLTLNFVIALQGIYPSPN